MDQLPVEVLEQIFGYLDNFSKFCCSFVCKRWSELIDFYGTKTDGSRQPTRLKLTCDVVKFYTDTEFLRSVPCPDGKFREILSECVFPYVGTDVTRIKVICLNDFDISRVLLQIPTHPSNVQAPSLTMLYLDAVEMTGNGFVAMCAKFGQSLKHFYLTTRFSGFKTWKCAEMDNTCGEYAQKEESVSTVSSDVQNANIPEVAIAKNTEVVAEKCESSSSLSADKFDVNALKAGLQFLVNVEHLNLKELKFDNDDNIFAAKPNPAESDAQTIQRENNLKQYNSADHQQDQSCLAVIAEFCPNLITLALSEHLHVTSRDVNTLLMSQNSRNLTYLCVMYCRDVDDQIEQGLDFRSKLEPPAPDLTLFIGNTSLSNRLLQKYSPFYSTSTHIHLDPHSSFTFTLSQQYLFYDERYHDDWPASETGRDEANDADDSESSISRCDGYFGYNYGVDYDFDELDDDDDDDDEYYDDYDDFEGGDYYEDGNDEFYG